jgi:DNA polymerase
MRRSNEDTNRVSDRAAVQELEAHLEFFGELGIEGIRRDAEWRSRASDRTPAIETIETVLSQPAVLLSSPGEALVVIRQDLGECTRCKLHCLGRRQIVFGVGNPAADLMFVGEAPGADEDIQGEPFVGRAGQLLTKIIEAIGLRREDVYIANVIKCRPPGNRNPEPDEVEQCEPFLFGQIDTIKPKVIVALGKFAAQSLLRTVDPITRLRGREYKYRDAILIPTYHPAYLLRTPSAKRDVWEDMKRVRAILAFPIDSRSCRPSVRACVFRSVRGRSLDALLRTARRSRPARRLVTLRTS